MENKQVIITTCEPQILKDHTEAKKIKVENGSYKED